MREPLRMSSEVNPLIRPGGCRWFTMTARSWMRRSAAFAVGLGLLAGAAGCSSSVEEEGESAGPDPVAWCEAEASRQVAADELDFATPTVLSDQLVGYRAFLDTMVANAPAEIATDVDRVVDTNYRFFDALEDADYVLENLSERDFENINDPTFDRARTRVEEYAAANCPP